MSGTLSGTVVAPLDKVGAVALTARIRTAVNETWRLLEEAYQRRAWEPLGYPSFRAYVRAELDIGKSQAYRLIAKAEVVRALAVSPAGDTAIEDAVASEIPARRAEEVRAALPDARRTATRARKAARARGAEPTEAAAAGARAVIDRLPTLRPPAPTIDEDRRRRAAEYAARTGRGVPSATFSAAEAVPRPPKARHCGTCTCP